MEADQVGFAVHGITQAQPCELAVAGVDVVQVDVLRGKRNHGAPVNVRRGQQEQGVVAHEVLDVGQAELRLNGNSRRTEVVIEVQHVCEADHVRDGLAHFVELVQNRALRLRKGILEGRRRYGQLAGVQEGVEPGQDNGLQFIQECIVGLLDGVLRAVLGDVLDGNGLGVLFDGQVVHSGLDHGSLGVGDHSTGRNLTAFQRHTGRVAYQLSAGGLADRPHDAQNIPECVPIPGEPGNEINLPRRHVGKHIRQTGTGGSSGFNRSRHIIHPFCG